MRKILFSVIAAGLATFSSAVFGAVLQNAIPTAQSPSIRLGDNWYAHETYQGASFRWVADNAQLIVFRQPTSEAKLLMTLEAGPSLGHTTFPLYIVDAHHHVVQTVSVKGKSTVILTLPVAKADAENPFAETVFYLHVDGANHAVPHDSRELNFRVFSIADLRPIVGSTGPDVVDPRNFVRIGDGWYPDEHSSDQTFRWVDNDARFYVQSDKDQRAPVRVLFSAGPSVTGHYTLKLIDASGKTVGQIDGSGSGQKRFEQVVALSKGDNAFTLHIDGGGKPVASDPHRILDFRVFSIAAVR